MCLFYDLIYTGFSYYNSYRNHTVDLQTMMVIIAGILLRPKEILASYGVYFLMGFDRITRFCQRWWSQLCLTAIFWFPIIFPFCGLSDLCSRHKYELTHFYQLYPLCLCALCFIYLMGCGYMYLIFNYYMGSAKDISSIIAIGAAPFVISDSISMAVGCFCAIRLSMVSSIKRILICE